MDQKREYQAVLYAVLGTLFPRAEFLTMDLTSLLSPRIDCEPQNREILYGNRIRPTNPHKLPLPINHKVYGLSRRVTRS